MSTVSVESVCEDFKNAVAAIVDDEDFVANIELTGDSIISQDLEMDSVEIVRTFEYFLRKYDEAPLIEWFSGLEVTKLQTLTVADLVEFLQQYY